MSGARAGLGAAALAISTLLLQDPARAADPRAGRRLALDVCYACHVVADDQEFAPALNTPGPAFREIANRPGVTAAQLRDSVRSRHPIAPTPQAMPNPELTPEQLDDVVSYILSLRVRR